MCCHISPTIVINSQPFPTIPRSIPTEVGWLTSWQITSNRTPRHTIQGTMKWPTVPRLTCNHPLQYAQPPPGFTISKTSPYPMTGSDTYHKPQSWTSQKLRYNSLVCNMLAEPRTQGRGTEKSLASIVAHTVGVVKTKASGGVQHTTASSTWRDTREVNGGRDGPLPVSRIGCLESTVLKAQAGIHSIIQPMPLISSFHPPATKIHVPQRPTCTRLTEILGSRRRAISRIQTVMFSSLWSPTM